MRQVFLSGFLSVALFSSAVAQRATGFSTSIVQTSPGVETSRLRENADISRHFTSSLSSLFPVEAYSETTFSFSHRQYQKGQRLLLESMPGLRSELPDYHDGVARSERVVRSVLWSNQFFYSVLEAGGDLERGVVTRNYWYKFDGMTARAIQFAIGRTVLDLNRETKAKSILDTTESCSEGPPPPLPDAGDDCWGLLRSALGLPRRPINQAAIAAAELNSLINGAIVVPGPDELLLKVENGHLVRLITLDKETLLPINVQITGSGGLTETRVDIEYMKVDAPTRRCIIPSAITWKLFAHTNGGVELALEKVARVISFSMDERAKPSSFDISAVLAPSETLSPLILRSGQNK